MLHIKGSAEHSRCTCPCVDRPPRSADEQLHNNALHRKCLRKKTTACVSLFVFFTARRGTFPYSIEDDFDTTPTIHYTNTCVKLTIVTHLSFSERIAIVNLSYSFIQHARDRITNFAKGSFGGMRRNTIFFYLGWPEGIVSIPVGQPDPTRPISLTLTQTPPPQLTAWSQ